MDIVINIIDQLIMLLIPDPLLVNKVFAILLIRICFYLDLFYQIMMFIILSVFPSALFKWHIPLLTLFRFIIYHVLIFLILITFDIYLKLYIL